MQAVEWKKDYDEFEKTRGKFRFVCWQHTFRGKDSFILGIGKALHFKDLDKKLGEYVLGNR